MNRREFLIRSAMGVAGIAVGVGVMAGESDSSSMPPSVASKEQFEVAVLLCRDMVYSSMPYSNLSRPGRLFGEIYDALRETEKLGATVVRIDMSEKAYLQVMKEIGADVVYERESDPEMVRRGRVGRLLGIDVLVYDDPRSPSVENCVVLKAISDSSLGIAFCNPDGIKTMKLKEG